MTNRLSKTIPDESFNRGIQIESAGDPDARAGSSSAGGLGQFLTGTWQAVGLLHYPDEVKRAGPRWADMRVGKNTAALQLRMMARFWEDNARVMGSTRPGDLYLAHFLGAGGAKRVVAANQSDSAVVVCGEKAARANPTIFYRKDAQGQRTIHVTCAQLREWAEASMAQRWDKNGRKDWVGIWLGGAQVPLPVDAPVALPPKQETKTSKTIKTIAVAVGTGGAAAGTAASTGASWQTIVAIGGMFAVVTVALFFIIRSARR